MHSSLDLFQSDEIGQDQLSEIDPLALLKTCFNLMKAKMCEKSKNDHGLNLTISFLAMAAWRDM